MYVCVSVYFGQFTVIIHHNQIISIQCRMKQISDDLLQPNNQIRQTRISIRSESIIYALPMTHIYSICAFTLIRDCTILVFIFTDVCFSYSILVISYLWYQVAKYNYCNIVTVQSGTVSQDLVRMSLNHNKTTLFVTRAK
jgi:hypothetical protein